MATRFVLHRLLKTLPPLSLVTHDHLPTQTPSLLPNLRALHVQTRSMAHASVNLILSPDNRPRFETLEPEAPNKRKKWQTKKRLKERRRREKRKRREANKRDPRRIRPKGKKIKQRFATAEERIKYKIEKV